MLGLIFTALPHALSNGLSSIISGTLVSPFIALVVTLVYYRLSGAPLRPRAAGCGIRGIPTECRNGPGRAYRRAACLTV